MSAHAGRALTQPTPRRVNCSEYFPLFLATLWVAGIFFHEGAGYRGGILGGWSPNGGNACSPHRLASCRRRSPVRTVLPVRAAPLLPGIRALRTAQVTRAGLPGKHCRGGSLLDATLRVGGGDRPQGTHGKRSGVGGWAVVAQESRSNPAWEGPEPEGRA